MEWRDGEKRAVEVRPECRVCCRFLGESQAGLCESPGASVDQGGLNRKNFSKRKRENRGTQLLVRELFTAATASGNPPPSAHGL